MVAVLPRSSNASSLAGVFADSPVEDHFANVTPLGFEAGDENLTRYVGNNATGLTDSTGLDDKEDLLKALGQKPAAQKPTVADIGKMTLSTAKGDAVNNVQITGFVNGNVTFTYMVGKEVTNGTKPINVFSKDDQTFLGNLQAVPPNIIIDPKSVGGVKNKEEWVRAVVNEFGLLAKLAKGKEILGLNQAYPVGLLSVAA